ncbi:hypothetical protein EIB96_04515 [Vibrio parahaemolyticus]|uniref:hypothetical protein n=1 Tax=Vibrio parahaemolyticus TaxID=670 RepID=UPI00038E4D4C|nr:hypothetical protein [Vibrio parahaemolyticus]RFD41741.1 hypothetical protein H328_007165 [Vibrio parahaemolyticus 3355]EGR0921904.1 hypothetical protein [Vibrio parahaemolyticus]EGR0988083.1 hypothetical protein [Vibrio parahaemolyticus]EGR1155923.1 hypothetical protein [Vibrio parahaemolyticus]EGR1372349.1 hypothetical protein [Vibrio parahaemolyticus]
MIPIEKFIARTLNHSSRAEKIGDYSLANSIVKIKLAKNEKEIQSLSRKIESVKSNASEIKKYEEKNKVLTQKRQKYTSQQHLYSGLSFKTQENKHLKPTAKINFDYDKIGSSPINDYLRKNDERSLTKTFGSEGIKNVESMIRCIDSGRVEGDPISVFRIASDDYKVLTNAKIGDVVSDKGFISSGTDKTQMLNSDFFFEITGATDTVPVVITITGNPAIVEKGRSLEAIFPPNSMLMVTEKTWENDVANNSSILHISLLEKRDYNGVYMDIYKP